MRNITITVDEDTAQWARIEAARRDTSVSRLVGEMLAEYVRAERGYEDAMRSYLARKPKRLKSAGSYPSRESLHDRAGVR